MKRNFKRFVALLLVLLFVIAGAASLLLSVRADDTTYSVQATYLGVTNYGLSGTTLNNSANFTYRFSVGGSEQRYRIAGGSNYPIQNVLKEGADYVLTVTDGTVISVAPVEGQLVMSASSMQVNGTPGVRTVRNFLKTAMMPVGTTLYVFGGGWNWQDTAAGAQARTIGVPYDWVKFYGQHAADYSYKDGTAESYYPYGGFNEYYYAGLDCSGYVGWTLYNTFETVSGGRGYVRSSTNVAKALANKGWGTWSQVSGVKDSANGAGLRPGDIVSLNGHVWISLGTCSDGSVLIAHSTPSENVKGQPGGGVQLSALGASTSCEAYKLADNYMSAHCASWHRNYPTLLVYPGAYLTFTGSTAGIFSWNGTGENGGLTDPDGIRAMQPKDVLNLLLAK